MSQSVSSGSDKCSRQGILRIFRQSVRELGHRTKADAASLGKENVKVCGNLIEKSCKESIEINTETDVKRIEQECFNRNDKKILHANRKVELGTTGSFKVRQAPRFSRKTSPKKDGYPKERDTNNNVYRKSEDIKDDFELEIGNKDSIELTGSTVDNFAYKRKSDAVEGLTSNGKSVEDKHGYFESLNCEFGWKNVTENVHKTDSKSLEVFDTELEKITESVKFLEDCDNELEKITESRSNSENEQAGFAVNVCQLECANATVADNINEDGIPTEHLDVSGNNGPQIAKSKSVETSQGLLEYDKLEKADCVLNLTGNCCTKAFANDYNADIIPKTSKKGLDCDAELSEVFTVVEDIRLEHQNLPLHSTPKKQAHRKQDLLVTALTDVKGGYSSIMGRKRNLIQTSYICCGDDGARKSQYLPYERKKSNFKKPPRFITYFDEKGNIEQTAKSAESSENRKFPEFQQKNQVIGHPRSELGSGYGRFVKSPSYSRSSREFIDWQDHGNLCKQRDFLDSEKMSLIDTPEKRKTVSKGRSDKKWDSDFSNKARSLWKMPVSEDWSFEMYDIGDMKDESEGKGNSASKDDFTHTKINMKTDESVFESDLQGGTCKIRIVKQQTENDECEKYASKKDFLVQNVSVLESLEENRHDFSDPSVTRQLQGDEIDSKSLLHNENETMKKVDGSDVKNEMCTSLLKHGIYLPPAPVEVIECGHEMNLTSENYVMSDGNSELNESDRYSELFAFNSTEVYKENVFDCLRSKIKTTENAEVSDENKLIENSNKIVHKSVKENVGHVVENITHGGVESVTDASEVEVSELPFDESQVGQNDIEGFSMSEGFCNAKSFEEVYIDTRTLNTDVELTEFEIERYNYEQYAQYWYEQDAMNAGGQFGPWHPNYPYNYEAYRRWCTLKQYEMSYYWEMYYKQMHYTDQMSAYYAYYNALPYLSEEKKGETERYNEMDSYEKIREGKFNETEHKESKNCEKGKARKSHTQITENKLQLTYDFVQTNGQYETAESTHLSEYWNERMHQWVKNQSQEDTDTSNFTDLKSDVISERLKLNNKMKENCLTTLNIPVDCKMKASQSAVLEQCTLGVNDKTWDISAVGLDNAGLKLKDLESEGIDPEIQDTSHREKEDISCSCKPSHRLIMVWRVCDCQAGNPPKLQKILSNFDDRSLDLGYQSYESLEHDESTEGRKVGHKAPGFMLKHLWSPTRTQSSNIESTCNTEKGQPTVSKIFEESVSTRRVDKIQPPPGFEKVVSDSWRQKGKTGMKRSQDLKTVLNQEIINERVELNNNNQSERDLKHGVTSPVQSLKSLIEQQNLQHWALKSCSSNRGTISADEVKQPLLAGSSALPFIEGDFSKLPLCVSTGVEHLKKAHIAIATAEMSQANLMNSLKSAVDMKINELQERIFEYDSVQDAEKEPDRRDGSVGHIEKGTENCEMKAAMSDRGTPLKVSGQFGASKEEMHSNSIDFEVGKVKTKIALSGESLYVPEQDNGSFSPAGKNKVEDSRDVQLIDQCFTSVSSGESYRDNSGTSSDENTNFTVFTQSPLSSDVEEVNIRCSKMVENQSEKKAAQKKNITKFEQRVSNEICYDIKEESIPVNEMLESESMYESEEAMKLGTNSRAEMEVLNKPRMCYTPRFPWPSFPPPYRGGTQRPPISPVSHMEHWPMDPRYSLPPPHLRYWPPPAMYGAPYRQSWENMPQMFHHPYDSKLEGKEKAQTGSRCAQPVPYHHFSGRDGCIEQTNTDCSERNEKSGQARKERSALKLVDYELDSGDGSSTEIEPFDCSIFCKTEGENYGKSSSQLKPIPKKLKTDTDDETSSVDSSGMDNKLHASTKTTVKLSRGPTKKLKQKSLKSFSSSDRHRIHQPLKIDTTDKHRDKTKSKSLSEVIAETNSTRRQSRGNFNSNSVNITAQEFMPHSSEKKKQLPPLPPLPPFPNSPFWSMYSPGNSSALTGKKEDNQSRQENSSKLHRRNWQPASPFRRYSYSPTQASGLNSLSETDSEAASISRDWKTNFKLFHDFGVKYIDTHCHLDFIFSREGFKGTFQAYMDKHSETFPEMFEGCVAVFCNPNTFTPAGGLWLDVAKEPNVWIAMGCHPKMATDFTAAAELGLKKCLRHPKCIALGEIGLDYSGTFYQHAEVQKQVFRRQLKMAVEMTKVLVIHCRQAEDDCLEIMKEMVPPKWKIHCHCFTNGYENAKLWIDAFPNLFIGVTPLVTYKTAKLTHDLARKLPITKLLLETDAPYFVPRCIPREELQLSNPGVAVTVAKEIAQYQELSVAAVLRQCRLNTNFMYGI